MTSDPSRDSYDVWTRRAVVYLPITLGDKLVGYLWGTETGSAAGYFAYGASGISHVKSSIFWFGKLDDAYRRGLTPVEAISDWIGKPADAQFGGIASDAEFMGSRTIQDLALQLNPDAPLGEGPWVQDGEYPSGTPENRSDGWGSLSSVPTSTYPEDTTSPVMYLPITRDDIVLGYLWASTSDNAAGYLQRAAVGREGMVAGGLWRSRLIDAYEAGRPAVEVLSHSRSLPIHAPEFFGVISEGASEHRAVSLSELQRMADNI
ncbi:hypothetical protein GFY24_14445 [Nocardia sp. SYP-A9097]|uniref:hypothetical protein n=1 Tax=Nocardia sp. SYP-A9097 TaxID=2663237 RepID=UPI00129B65C9|nr:hypothetical protein [Nocardia sp. SYP-A9097]MRH88628.1 hypothetical protein [Nocardia sp. SYP-A9097]